MIHFDYLIDIDFTILNQLKVEKFNTLETLKRAAMRFCPTGKYKKQQIVLRRLGDGRMRFGGENKLGGEFAYKW